MKRRTVLAGIAAAVVRAPLLAQAQQGPNIRLIGVLMTNRANDPVDQSYAAGWKEGGNLRIDWRWAGGDPALFERCAAELVALGPEVVVTFGSAVEALRRQTSTIPIVFTQATDPVGQGFVASLARPGGNVTGFSMFDPPMAGKWLGMLTQIVPPATRVAVLYNPATAPYAGLFVHASEEAAPSLGVVVRVAPVQDDAEIETTMIGLAREERGGLVVLPDAFTAVHRSAIVGLAARYRLPAVYSARGPVANGGLMSYGTDVNDMYRRSAAYVDRILKGAKPGDLPVQAPTKFELVINLKTAQALGLTIPPTLLARADEVIEQ